MSQPFLLLFALAGCSSSGPYSTRSYGRVTDRRAFAKAACGPYTPHKGRSAGPEIARAAFLATSGRRADMNACYLLEMKRLPDVLGCVAFEFRFDEASKVSSVRNVWNTTGASELVKCLEGVLKSVQTSGAGPGEYVQSFVFTQG
jgi:hypothetical protein